MKEREVFMRRVLGMSERDFRQHWVARIYRGDAVSTPAVVSSDDAARRHVKAAKGGVAFLRLGASTDGVRVALTVQDGHAPP